MTSVFPEWISQLPFQQQSVLTLATRGPDGVGKFHGCKHVVRAYRAYVLKAAYFGRELRWGENADTFMTLHMFADLQTWNNTVELYFEGVDEIPHHYHMHLMHGAEILAYKHPDEPVRARWIIFYVRCCQDAHLTMETEMEMDARLSDWFQIHWGE